MKQSYIGLFQDWEVAVARNLVNEFREKQPCLQREGVEDLMQECLTRWFFVRDDYDPTREASPKTFMGRIIRNKLTDILREQQADKRKVAHLTISLDVPLGNDADSATLLDKLDDSAATDNYTDAFSEVDLRMDLAKVLPKLDSRQKNICHLLGKDGLSIKKASNRLGTPRSTTYDEIERIRKIFQKEGLQEYLE